MVIQITVEQIFSKIIETMYNQLNDLLEDLKQTIILIAGDFNAKVGKKKADEECLGNYSRGVRNNSGEQLTNFCTTNNLFVTNTAFKHRASHITTWANQRTDPKDPTKTVTIYNQIDYILCNKDIKSTLINARSFSGSETTSDHRLVICKMSINRYKLFKNKPKANRKQIDSAELARNKQKQQIYKVALENKLSQTETTNWKQIEQAIIETATETVGYKQKHQRHRVHNPEIERLSRQQKEIRLAISQTDNNDKVKELKQQRNRILHQIENSLNEQKKHRTRSISYINRQL